MIKNLSASNCSNKTAYPPVDYRSICPDAEGNIQSTVSVNRPLLAKWIMGISIVAVVITGYLSYVSLSSSKVLGCGGGLFDCDHVIGSRWSGWFGIPVSLFACGLYITLAGLSSLSSHPGRPQDSMARLWTGIGFLGLTAGIAAVWFIVLQVFVLKHLCSWCLVAHACGLAIAFLVLCCLPLVSRRGLYTSICSVACVAVLAVSQYVSDEKPTFEVVIDPLPSTIPDENGGNFDDHLEFLPPGDDISIRINSSFEQSPKRIRLQPTTAVWNVFSIAYPLAAIFTSSERYSDPQPLSSATQNVRNEDLPVTESVRRFAVLKPGEIMLDVEKWPLIGNRNAKYVFIEMFDYCCEHCRQTHETVQQTIQARGDNLAVLVLPVPMNVRCNSAIQTTGAKMAESCEISELAVAVWRLDAQKFQEFHHWMMTGKAIPTYAQARTKAIELLADKPQEKAAAEERLTKELKNQIPSQYIAKHVSMYRRIGGGVVPKLVFSDTRVVGAVTSPDTLLRIVDEKLKNR